MPQHYRFDTSYDDGRIDYHNNERVEIHHSTHMRNHQSPNPCPFSTNDHPNKVRYYGLKQDRREYSNFCKHNKQKTKKTKKKKKTYNKEKTRNETTTTKTSHYRHSHHQQHQHQHRRYNSKDLNSSNYDQDNSNYEFSIDSSSYHERTETTNTRKTTFKKKVCRSNDSDNRDNDCLSVIDLTSVLSENKNEDYSGSSSSSGSSSTSTSTSFKQHDSQDDVFVFGNPIDMVFVNRDVASTAGTVFDSNDVNCDRTVNDANSKEGDSKSNGIIDLTTETELSNINSMKSKLGHKMCREVLSMKKKKIRDNNGVVSKKRSNMDLNHSDQGITKKLKKQKHGRSGPCDAPPSPSSMAVAAAAAAKVASQAATTAAVASARAKAAFDVVSFASSQTVIVSSTSTTTTRKKKTNNLRDTICILDCIDTSIQITSADAAIAAAKAASEAAMTAAVASARARAASEESILSSSSSSSAIVDAGTPAIVVAASTKTTMVTTTTTTTKSNTKHNTNTKEIDQRIVESKVIDVDVEKDVYDEEAENVLLEDSVTPDTVPTSVSTMVGLQKFIPPNSSSLANAISLVPTVPRHHTNSVSTLYNEGAALERTAGASTFTTTMPYADAITITHPPGDNKCNNDTQGQRNDSCINANDDQNEGTISYLDLKKSMPVVPLARSIVVGSTSNQNRGVFELRKSQKSYAYGAEHYVDKHEHQAHWERRNYRSSRPEYDNDHQPNCNTWRRSYRLEQKHSYSQYGNSQPTLNWRNHDDRNNSSAPWSFDTRGPRSLFPQFQPSPPPSPLGHTARDEGRPTTFTSYNGDAHTRFEQHPPLSLDNSRDYRPMALEVGRADSRTSNNFDSPPRDGSYNDRSKQHMLLEHDSPVVCSGLRPGHNGPTISENTCNQVNQVTPEQRKNRFESVPGVSRPNISTGIRFDSTHPQSPSLVVHGVPQLVSPLSPNESLSTISHSSQDNKQRDDICATNTTSVVTVAHSTVSKNIQPASIAVEGQSTIDNVVQIEEDDSSSSTETVTEDDQDDEDDEKNHSLLLHELTYTKDVGSPRHPSSGRVCTDFGDNCSLEYSVGRTRAQLNKHIDHLQLRAAFGNSAISSRKNTVSHLTISSLWNYLPQNKSEILEFWLEEGIKKLVNALILDPAYSKQDCIPIFWTHPNNNTTSHKKLHGGGELCHYIGHYRCIAFRKIEDKSKYVEFRFRTCQAVLDFQFHHYCKVLHERIAKIVG